MPSRKKADENSAVVIGSRTSVLAKLQAVAVGEWLQKQFPSVTPQFLFKKSQGDIDLVTPLWKTERPGFFTHDLRDLLKSGEVQMVVHSWKDLPVEPIAESSFF